MTLISLLLLGAFLVVALVLLVRLACLPAGSYEGAEGISFPAKPGVARRLVGDPAELDWDGGEGKRTA